MSSTALYFPHTVCNDKSLLKSALFLFDDLEYIIPWKNFDRDNPPKDPQVREAMELMGRPIMPAHVEQEAAHKEIVKVCKGKVAKKLNFRPSKKAGNYLIFPQKFDYKTWELLEKKKLTQQLDEEFYYDYAVAPSLGHFLMAMLALACSQGKKQLVTDRPDAFKALYLASADELRSSSSNLDDVHKRLLNIRIKGFDFSRIRFSRPLNLRTKEGSLLSDLRQNYLRTHQECLSEVEKVSDNLREIDKCVESYMDKAEKDLKELKRALRVHATTTLLSKTIISTIAGIASETIVPSSGFLTSSAVLTGQLAGYRDKRRELLKKHKFAWLYEVGTKYKLY
jgi:hypothetical protein